MSDGTPDEKIGEGLVRIGAMTPAHVEEILEIQAGGNDSLFGIIALESGFVDEDVLLDYLESRGL